MTALGFFRLVAFAYAAYGLIILTRFVVAWPRLFDRDLTPEDAGLVRKAAFFVLVPPMVALHELGHAAAIWAEGLEVQDWAFYGYMGWVSHAPASPLGNFTIALAGNLVLVLAGGGLLWLGLSRPGGRTRNILTLELARQVLFLELVFYPVLCLGFPGDYQTIYDFESTPWASSVVLVGHAVCLLYGWGHLWRRRWRPRAVLLQSAFCGHYIDAQRKLAKDSNDAEAHRTLADLALRVDDSETALVHLAGLIESGKAEAPAFFAYASALLLTSRPSEAIEPARTAVQLLKADEERRAATIVLARALSAASQNEEATAISEALRAEYPNDLAVLTVWAHVLLGAGRRTEAQQVVEHRLNEADEGSRPTLRRLYEELRS